MVGVSIPLEESAAVNEQVMVCIEHVTKWVEVIPLPSKCFQNSVRGFMEGFRSRYGALLTNQGREFTRESHHELA